jgi:hypothetical protein
MTTHELRKTQTQAQAVRFNQRKEISTKVAARMIQVTEPKCKECQGTGMVDGPECSHALACSLCHGTGRARTTTAIIGMKVEAISRAASCLEAADRAITELEYLRIRLAQIISGEVENLPERVPEVACLERDLGDLHGMLKTISYLKSLDQKELDKQTKKEDRGS